MEQKWRLVRALLGGTMAMREAAADFLPQYPKEEADVYKHRLECSFLKGFYADAVENVVSLPFSKEVSFDGELPSPLEPMLDNIDREGNNITQFARALFRDAVAYGKSHILVEYPTVTENENDIVRAERGIYPYFVHVKADQLIGWQQSDIDDGVDPSQMLSQVRIKTQEVRAKGDYGEELVHIVRVYSQSDYATYESINGSEYVLNQDKSGLHTFGKIPLYTVYAGRENFLVGYPPMYRVAETELEYWQSASDQRNILSVARFPVLFGSGWSEQQATKLKVLGPTRMITHQDEKSDLKFVEHSGASIAAGERDLDRLERLILYFGVQPLMRQGGDVTATGEGIGARNKEARVQTWVRNLEYCLNQAMQAAADITNQDIGDFSFNVYNEYALPVIGQGDVATLAQLFINNKLPAAAFFEEIKRRGIISEQWDTDKLARDVDNSINIPEFPDSSTDNNLPPADDE